MFHCITRFYPVLLISVGACQGVNQPGMVSSDEFYPGVPVLSRDWLQVSISPTPARCYGMMSVAFACFTGITQDGETIKFDEGIDGYQFTKGKGETIHVERITYDFTSGPVPQDVSSIRYVLVPG